MRPNFLNPRLRRRLALGLGVGALVSLVALALRATPPLEVAEAKSYDLRAGWLADLSRADSSIIIVAIDDNSLDIYGQELGRWPWDREAYVPLMVYAAVGGARALVFDITFGEPHLHYPLGDTLLAETLAETGMGVMAFTLSPGDSATAAEWYDKLAQYRGAERTAATRRMLEAAALGVAEPGADGRGRVPDYPYVEPTYELIGSAAAALGAINWSPDRDGVTRRQHLLFAHRGMIYPSLPLAAARVLDPERYGGEPVVTDDAVSFGDTRIPLDDGRLIVNWRGPYMRAGQTTYRVIPAFHVMDAWKAVSTGHEPEIPLETFDGKVVVVAATSIGAFETRATPVSSHDPGVIVHATILDNLLQGDFLRRASWPANLGILLATALLAALLAVLFDSALVATAGALLALAGATLVATWALASGVWLDLAAPLLAGALAFSGAMVGNYLTEGRDKRRVRELFGRYVSPEYVSQLADNYQNVKLGGQRIPVTLLFSDIRGFTSLSERLDPEVVVEMLNEYLDRMAEVVFRHGGTLDKFIGDAVMAFWNAPVPVEDHARRAVEAALDMLEELETLNQRWASAGADSQLRIGIGINTGDAIVGNIGSLTRKLDYTAIGDTVNLAARLEGLNKEYGSSIIVSEATRAALPGDAYELRPIDDVKVKGKEKSVRIFEMKGRKQTTPRGRGASLVTAVALGAILAVGAAPAAGQATGQDERARWTDWVYRPGAWQGTRVTELVTSDAATDSLALVARVELYAAAPRWRAEFREVVTPDSLAPPVVLVVDGEERVILTRLGSTALEQHAAAADPVVQAILARVRGGRPTPEGPARIVETDDDGRVRFVIVRKPAARVDFEDGLLKTGTAGRLGRSMARLGMHAIGGERDQEVVASAGARGVAKVQTVDGEITVMPDTAAVLRMERVEIGIITLDRFLREGGIRSVPLETAKQEEEGV